MTQASDSIEAQAAQWLIRTELTGSPESWSALDAWLAANPRHRAAFLRLSVAWQRAERLRRLKAFDGSVDLDLLSPRMLRARKAAERRKSGWQSQWIFGWRAAAAASLLAIAVYALGPMAISHLATQTYATQIGAQQHIRLADGSTIDLNTDTQLRVRFSDERREVMLLRGEALFKVAHEPGRPFDVQAGRTTLRAVGTAFSVRLQSSMQVHVQVTEGRVAIDPPSTRLLTPGATAVVTANRVTVTPVPLHILSKRLQWTEGRLFFNGETLAQAVEEFNRYNRRRLLVTDPRFAGSRISGTYVATDPGSFAMTVRTLPALSAARSAVVRLESKER